MLNQFIIISLHGSWPFWLIVLISGSLIVYFVTRRAKRTRKLIEDEVQLRQRQTAMEWKAFQSQMDPHFIFNSLNAIQHFILSTSTEEASLHLARFSRLMRLTIDHCGQEWISLEDDLDALELYIQLEQLRFEGKFYYQIDIEPGLETHQVKVPPFIVQPYVHDAIWKHLLVNDREPAGILKISVASQYEELVIRLEDNVEPEWMGQNIYRYRPAAKDVTHDRLNFLRERYDTSIQVDTGQLFKMDGACNGAYTVIRLPLFYNSVKMNKLGKYE